MKQYNTRHPQQDEVKVAVYAAQASSSSQFQAWQLLLGAALVLGAYFVCVG
ncbi:MAG: hypothetical protein F6J97_21425 [Leptolyngbya sp. SIO4C1]|nr:hypothetical protein [Leptolyngbya sp. SIO4C1]